MDTSTVSVAVDTLGRRIARWRRRTVEEKLAIVAESRVLGASVAEVARRHAVNANQVFAWRREQEQGVLGRRTRRGGVRLLPVRVSEEEPLARCANAPITAREGRIEITLGEQIHIAIVGEVAIERIERVLAVLRCMP